MTRLDLGEVAAPPTSHSSSCSISRASARRIAEASPLSLRPGADGRRALEDIARTRHPGVIVDKIKPAVDKVAFK